MEPGVVESSRFIGFGWIDLDWVGAWEVCEFEQKHTKPTKRTGDQIQPGMKRISLIPAKPKESGSGGLYVEHGSWSDGGRKEAEGVTPLWTVFHLYNYFRRYFTNFGFWTGFSKKKAGILTHRRSMMIFSTRSGQNAKIFNHRLRDSRIGSENGENGPD